MLFSIVVTIGLVRILNQTAGGRYDTGSILEVVAYTSLINLPALISLALFLAVFMTLNRYWRDSEMFVWFSAGGLSLTSWIRPVLRFALPVILVVAACSVAVSPWSRAQVQAYRDRFAQKEDISKLSSGRFIEAKSGRQVFFLEGVDQEKGKVKITVYSKETKVKKTYKIKTEEVPQISFKNGNKATVKYGNNYQIVLQYTNHDTEKIQYKSEDQSIATVDANGLVTTKRPGEVYITVTPSKKKETLRMLLVVENKTGFFENSLLYDNIDTSGCNKLMIVAHPDDETLWGGAHLKSGNWFVVCLTNHFTDVRKNEFKSVMEKAGIKGIILDYPDLVRDANKKWVKYDWDSVKDGVAADVTKLIKSKNWDLIATHSPAGETGHIHHKNTDQAVTNACISTGNYDKLWYFGKCYWKIPSGLKRITDEELTFKQSLVDLYKNETKPINTYWAQMIPYENWVKATDYVAGK